MKFAFLFAFLIGLVQIFMSLALDAHFLSDEYINSINARQDSWQAGRNFDADTPLSDIKVLMGARLDETKDKAMYLKTHDPAWPQTKHVPKKFDARRKWKKRCPQIGQILDQGTCSSDWAISATQAFADRICIATRGKQNMRLSTYNVLSCCYSCGFGCYGGWSGAAWHYFHEHGVPTGGLYNTSEGCQPYPIKSPCTHYGHSPYEKCADEYEGTPACPKKCTNINYKKSLDEDYHFAKEDYLLPADEVAIMKDIMAHGPVTAYFLVYDDFFNYKSGVYEPGKFSDKAGGHVVKLIGWGKEEGVPYWLVMNSWNEYWGDHGLIKIKRGSPEIELEYNVRAAEVIV